MPAAAALPLVRLKAEIAWHRRPDARAAARAQMASLLAASSRAGELETLARRHVAENAARAEFEFRHGVGARFPVENPERLHALRDGGGGLVHFMHHGPYVHLTGALKAVGVTCYAPIAGYYFTTPEPGMTGHRDRSHLLALMAGSPVFPAEGSGAIIPRLLAEGKLVGLASDLPGRLRSRFLGRDVLVAAGTAKLALATGKSITCLTFRRRRRGLPAVVVHPPIDPLTAGGRERLQAAIFAVHEPAVLAWPEALERPTERWTLVEEPAPA